MIGLSPTRTKNTPQTRIRWIDHLMWAFYFPLPGRGSYYVLQRNFFHFSYSLWANLLLIGLEPIFYLVAFGYGLGFYIGDVLGVSYFQYFGISLLLISGLMNTFTESTQSLRSRFFNPGSYMPYVLSPLPLHQIALGEMSWSALKGVFGSILVAVILFVSNTISFQTALVGVFFAGVLGWIFSALGVLVTMTTANRNVAIYIQSFVILPMVLFSGTYFPIDFLPDFIEAAMFISPITHAISITRYVEAGVINYNMFISFAVLFTYTVFLTNYATSFFEKRMDETYNG